MRTLSLAATVLLLHAAAIGQDSRPTSKPSKSDAPPRLELGGVVAKGISLRDIDGREYKTDHFEGRITVVNFWATRCPWQKGWDPTLSKIQEDYADKGVTFLMVNANQGNGEIVDKDLEDGQKPYQEIRKRLKDADLPYTVLVDHDHEVADIFGAKTTPDIFVFDKDARLVYRGLIDDDARGDKGDDATHHLRNALDVLVAGDALEPREDNPFGCSIKRIKKKRKKSDS